MAYKPKEGQDVFDVCLQFYGNIEAGLFELVKSVNKKSEQGCPKEGIAKKGYNENAEVLYFK
jgi:hypothetical protein